MAQSPPFRPLLIMGTRPEAIKMAPLVLACRDKKSGISPTVCFTGQHREMLRQVTDYFEIQPDYDLNVMQPGQSLASLTSRLLLELDQVVEQSQPHCLIAQGDTTSVLAAALISFYRNLPLVHVEAGLRTGNLLSPWPEEFNRRVTTLVSTLHCAPTEQAAKNLRREGVPEANIQVTGNTVIDALHYTAQRERGASSRWNSKYAFLSDRRMILVTTHRRENHGDGLSEIFQGLAELAQQRPDLAIVFPVHKNPAVVAATNQWLSGRVNVYLVDPVPYPEFVWLMDRSYLIVSDSGGVQEEAPSLRRPVVVVRETTERQEAVDCGAVVLVGSSRQALVQAVNRLLDEPTAYQAMQVNNSPFGDGHAAARIIAWAKNRFQPQAAALHSAGKPSC